MSEVQAVEVDDFAQLAARAASIDAAGVQVQAQQEAAEQKQDAAEAASAVDGLFEVLTLARSMLVAGFQWWPEFERVWNDGVLRGIAVNGAVIMQRHGWTIGELMTRWGPYLGLLGVMLPAAHATYEAIKQRRAENAAKERALKVPGGADVGNQQAAN